MTDPAERLRDWGTYAATALPTEDPVRFALDIDEALAQARAVGREEERERLEGILTIEWRAGNITASTAQRIQRAIHAPAEEDHD